MWLYKSHAIIKCVVFPYFYWLHKLYLSHKHLSVLLGSTFFYCSLKSNISVKQRAKVPLRRWIHFFTIFPFDSPQNSHCMHLPSKIWGGVKNFGEKNLLGRVRKFVWIWRGLPYGGSIFQGGGVSEKLFGKMENCIISV